MNSGSEFNWQLAEKIADAVVFKKTGKHLSDIEVKVLQGSWEGKSYQEIAEMYSYQESYINKDVGNKLWKKLSKGLGEQVSKNNFQRALFREWERTRQQWVVGDVGRRESVTNGKIEFPDKPVQWDSPFYVERYRVESECYEEVLCPGALIRIRAPENMGKTSLLNGILAQAALAGCYKVHLNLRGAEAQAFGSLERFLRWFSANVSLALEQELRLDDYWEKNSGSMQNCKRYFQKYILPKLDHPLVLGLDNVDRVFEYGEIAQDFLAMLRNWHEEANQFDIWQSFRLVMANSTEVYIKLDANQSPFNVGLPIRLPGFTLEQVQNLARLYGLAETEIGQLAELRDLVGGHPFLVQLALYKLGRRDVTLRELLRDAATQGGIYGSHLRHHWHNLQNQPVLATAMERVVMADTKVKLEPILAYKLESMGLVELVGDEVMVSCDLYLQYFRNSFRTKEQI
ncbi:MAG TPA: serine/threonine protein kinase [Cyanobacteria bacterium UBA8803]|nr:serine/threonine protein kinase [Cyanobacteria bacterium UBA9273]HBL57798.1 serine/threonine protein kinase [Cyanobacteria bacterium UBA8803]